MRLSRRSEPFDSNLFIYELKIDGFRALAHIEAGKGELISRNGNVFRGFAELAAWIAEHLRVESAVLDGEIACLDESGRPTFRDLIFRKRQCIFIAFDLLYLNGKDLRLRPLIERKAMLKRLSTIRASPIGFLCFSPDGQWISYVAASRLQKVSVAGGGMQDLAEAQEGVGPPTQKWETDGSILFSQQGRLMRVPASGGTIETLATPNSKQDEGLFFSPQLLPGGRKVLVTVKGRSTAKTLALDLKTGEKTVLMEGPEGAQYTPSGGPNSAIGYLAYFDPGVSELMAVPFDVGALRVQGGPVPIGIEPGGGQGPFAAYGFSLTGTLAYIPKDTAAVESTLVWVNEKGEEQPVAPQRQYNGAPRISPDGRKVALLIARNSALRVLGGMVQTVGNDDDVWIYDLTNGAFTRITSEDNNRDPVWSADSKRVFYGELGKKSRTARFLSAVADGTSAPIDLAPEGPINFPYSVSSDGALIGGPYSTTTQRGNLSRERRGGLWMLSVAQGLLANSKPSQFLPAGTDAQFSPDGRWVAYVGADSLALEIYVVPFPGPGERRTVSTGGGTDPRWAPDGRQLFYRNGDKMMVVDVPPGGTFNPKPPRVLFEKAGGYDFARDRRFLMIKPPSQTAQRTPEMHVILNWFEELRRRVPLGNK